MFTCLICGQPVPSVLVESHKSDKHPHLSRYGIMWPEPIKYRQDRDLRQVTTHRSGYLAEILGVDTVYVRDEGANLTGSMKDYLTEHGVYLGSSKGYATFTAVSSGNHAYSLASYASRNGCSAVVFTPANSSKIPMLRNLPGTFVVGVKDAIFEDVFALFSEPIGDGHYNTNVNNEELLRGFDTVAEDIANLDPQPTHIIAGVGNGSYLAGITCGLQQLGNQLPKIVPVGMEGAFPTLTAFRQGELLAEHTEFGVDESKIDAAEGSIAIASYSMPQLMHSLRLSGGFPLGGLTNESLAEAYRLIVNDVDLVANGAIPEPTGIMGLAAAVAHKPIFSSSDVLLISFTGSVIKDTSGIQLLVPNIASKLIAAAQSGHSHLHKPSDIPTTTIDISNNFLMVDKNARPAQVETAICQWREDTQ